MKNIQYGFLFLFIFFLAAWTTPGSLKNRPVKRIEYYEVGGNIEQSMSARIFSNKTGLYKTELYDSSGNLIRENGYDKQMNEDNVVEYRYDGYNRTTEKISYKNYYNQPLKKTYLSKYVYENDLLTGILFYYQTFDSAGFFAKNTFEYNQKKQKAREEYRGYNDEGGKETRIFKWNDAFSYMEDRINGEGVVTERHFVRLSKNGKELEHYINFSVTSKEDSAWQVYFITEYDSYGNCVLKISKYNGSPEERTSYAYRYDGSEWIYCLVKKHKGGFSTQFRRIEYY